MLLLLRRLMRGGIVDCEKTGILGKCKSEGVEGGEG